MKLEFQAGGTKVSMWFNVFTQETLGENTGISSSNHQPVSFHPAAEYHCNVR